MASSIKLHTTGNMEAAHAHNSPPEATGHPIELSLDNNLDTYWKSTSTASVSVQIDLNEAKSVDCILMFFKNYGDISSGTAEVKWSDNGSDWTFVSGTSNLTDTATPIRIRTTGLGLSHRYWQLTIVSPSHIVELAGLWWGRLFTVSQGNEYPEEDADRFYNNVAQLPGGRLGIAGVNKNSSRLIGRNYLISGSTDFNYIANAFGDSDGRRFPLVLNEGASQSDAFVVRFASDDFNRRQIDYLFYEVGVQFMQVPFIDDGDLY